MLNRNVWNSYWRLDPSSRWTWISSGAFYSESHGWAMVKTNGIGELATVFGRTLPGPDGVPRMIRRRY